MPPAFPPERPPGRGKVLQVPEALHEGLGAPCSPTTRPAWGSGRRGKPLGARLWWDWARLPRSSGGRTVYSRAGGGRRGTPWARGERGPPAEAGRDGGAVQRLSSLNL